MKFITIVSMAANRLAFKLDDVFHQSFTSIASRTAIDGHVFYQAHLSSTLKEGYDFLQSLYVERDSQQYQQAELATADLKYVVLAVADSFDVNEVLEKQIQSIYLYYPDNHINVELNERTEKNEKSEREMRASIEKLKKNRLPYLPEELAALEQQLADIIIEKEQIEKCWQAYSECPMQQFEVSLKTPELTPVMVRHDAMVGGDLVNYIRRTASSRFFDEPRTPYVNAYDNDNNAVEAPSLAKK